MFESSKIKNNVTLVLNIIGVQRLILTATIGILHNINFKANILFTKIKSISFSIREGKHKKSPPPSIKTKPPKKHMEKKAAKRPLIYSKKYFFIIF